MSFKSSPRLHERVNMFEWLCYWPVRCLTHASLSVWFRGRMLGHSFSHTFPSTSSHLCNGGFRTCFYTCTKLHRLVCDLVHMWSVELALLTFSSEHQIKQQLTTAGQGASSKTARIDGFVLEWFTRICQAQIKSLRGGKPLIWCLNVYNLLFESCLESFSWMLWFYYGAATSTVK